MTGWHKTLALGLTWLTTGMLATLAVPARAEWPPRSFDARYEVLVDGKRRLETRVRFQHDGADWRIESASEGRKGLARFLGVETAESAEGRLEAGRIVPRSFAHETEVAFKEKRWTAVFDWPAGTVRTTHDEGESVIALEAGTVDPLGLILQLQSFLEQGARDWELPVLDETEIEYERYVAEAPQRLHTPLGCIEAIEVRRLRDRGKRYSSMWLAPELDLVTVRMVHGKRDGHEFDLRITDLILNGERVERRSGCE